MPFEVRGLVKSYGGVPVLRGVDLSLADGEVHALLGANGAGKSTLIKCISGATNADSGEIIIDEHRHSALTPRDARLAGVAVIYQDLSLAPSLNVTENVFLGRELRRGPFVRRRDQEAVTDELLRRIGAPFSARAHLTELSNADLQVVEIVKALGARPRLLVLDEPTAALTEVEAAALAEQISALKRLGIAILYVTHRLGEVFELADRVTVLVAGQVAVNDTVANVTRQQLIDVIAGRSMAVAPASERAETGRSRHVLRARGLVADGIGPVDLTLRAGEVVGVYGLVGSGRTELCEALAGASRLHAGTLSVNDRPAHRSDGPGRRLAAGIALVPADRLRRSMFLSLSTHDNVLLPSMHMLSRLGLRRRGRERRVFCAAAAGLKLHPNRSDVPAQSLSGGNQQKLVVGRWLYAPHECTVLLLDEPTQGVDVGARAELYRAVRAAAVAGKAVLLTSSEPDELVRVADRVLVLGHGRVVADLTGDQIDETRLLSLAHLAEHPDTQDR